MPSDTIMKMQPEYARLETATDAGRIKVQIEEKLRHRGYPFQIREFWVTRVFPRRMGRFVVQYEINFEDPGTRKGRRVYFCGVLPGPEEEWPWYARPDNEKVIILDKIRMVIPVFPFDPKIKHLPEIIASLQGGDPGGSDKGLFGNFAASRAVTGYEILGYRLERRCVIKCSLGDGDIGAGGSPSSHIIVKVYRPGRALDPVEKLRWLRSSGFGPEESPRLTVPEVFFYDNEKGLTIVQYAPGVSAHDLLGESSFEEACLAAGGILCRLHAVKAAELKPYSVTDELETLEGKVELCGIVFPAIRERLLAAYDRLTSKEKSLDDEVPATVHGDFHDKQILYSKGHSTLLDCDNMKHSDPALDYGNFLAHLILRRIQHPNLAGNIGKGIRAFVRAYDKRGGGFEDRAGWWTAAALIRLVNIYSLRPRWRAIAAEIIRAAERVLQERAARLGGIDAVYL